MKRLLIACALLAGGQAVNAQFGAQQPLGDRLGDRRLDGETLARLQEWAKVLVNELDILHEEVEELRDPNLKRGLDRRCDDALEAVMTFQRAVKVGARVREAHRDMDRHLDELVEALQRLPPQLRGFHRTARRLRFADGQVDYYVHGRDPAPDVLPQLILGQARVLEHGANDLYDHAQLRLPDTEAGESVMEGIRRFSRQTSTFKARAERSGNMEALGREFLEVDRDWDRAARLLGGLPPRFSQPLYARADRVDAVYQRLGTLLRVEVRDHVFEGGGGPSNERRELEKLQGVWSLVLYQKDGRNVSGPNDTIQFHFQGNKWSHRIAGNEAQGGTVRVTDAGANPKHLDIALTEGQNRGANLPAVYEVDGETLKFGQSDIGRARPGYLGTREGDGYSFTVWKRMR